MTRKIPITIITGFLGTGKTTLLHQLLKNPEGRKIAVIVNEFGEVDVDGELLKSADCGCDEENLLELSNGCVCCTVQEEFLPTMQKLMERKDNIDHIVIETSGLALPKPLLRAVNWPDLKPHVTIDSVITVVDAVGQATGEICDRERVQRQRLADESLDHETPIEELFEDQLTCADLVIISKRDLVDDHAYDDIYQIIKNRVRNDKIKILAAERGNIESNVLLGLNAMAEDDLESRYSRHEASHENGHHHHHEGFQSIQMEVSVPHSPGQLKNALLQLVNDYEIYRIKGFVAVEGKPMRMVLQGVGDRFESYFDKPWKDGEPRKTSLVIVGNEIGDVDVKAIVEDNLKLQLT